MYRAVRTFRPDCIIWKNPALVSRCIFIFWKNPVTISHCMIIFWKNSWFSSHNYLLENPALVSRRPTHYDLLEKSSHGLPSHYYLLKKSSLGLPSHYDLLEKCSHGLPSLYYLPEKSSLDLPSHYDLLESLTAGVEPLQQKDRRSCQKFWREKYSRKRKYFSEFNIIKQANDLKNRRGIIIIIYTAYIYNTVYSIVYSGKTKKLVFIFRF